MPLHSHWAHSLAAALLLIVAGLPMTAQAEGEAAKEPVIAGEEEIARLIAQLGHDRYVLREHAQAKLEKIGPPTFDALTEALEHDDLEIANRARYLLGTIRFDWTSSTDPKYIQELLNEYAAKDESQRIEIINLLVQNGRDEELRVLCRIVRYDRSHRVSKRASLALMFRSYLTSEENQQKNELVLKQLTGVRRTAARWYRTVAAARANSEDAITELESFASSEHANLGTGEGNSGPDIVARLYYALADTYRRLGKADAANERAQMALAAGGGHGETHLLIATDLQESGMIDWAANEYRQAITLEPAGSPGVLQAHAQLAEMFHDQDRIKQAVDVLKGLIKLLQRNPGNIPRPDRLIQRFEAQMNYMSALHFEKLGDVEKQAEALEKSASQWPDYPDTLIALYRLPNRTPEQRAQIVQNVKTTVDGYRLIMQNENRQGMADGQSQNQFAWLVGNTLGETDEKLAAEAIRASHRSLELRPNSYAFTDTLARCYYASGDLETAINYQREALSLNPHSGLLQRQLKQFEKELADKKQSEE